MSYASGSTVDWTYGTANIIFSYGVELRDTGDYGFLLPENQIIPTGKETLAGELALLKYIERHVLGAAAAAEAEPSVGPLA
ncbi:unnamed protein product [Rotaria sordida]|uniref:Peptidase M14 domain-containing protein n=1 Tax=Rotaria sordida TaxID=392033 RepID=A0A819N0Y5_9BILA|nr:unnamed protein product [Rotaria sordida]